MMNVTLRTANLNDAEQVASVYLASRQTFLDFAPLKHSDGEVGRWIAGTLIPSGGVVVAEVGSEIVGMMATSVVDGVAWIEQLYLDPGFVRQGIGARMLELAKERLVAPIRLYAFQENSDARRFYERHGFRPICLSDGSGNEDNCPDVLYEFGAVEGST